MMMIPKWYACDILNTSSLFIERRKTQNNWQNLRTKPNQNCKWNAQESAAQCVSTKTYLNFKIPFFFETIIIIIFIVFISDKDHKTVKSAIINNLWTNKWVQ